jgi:hypothetical protein
MSKNVANKSEGSNRLLIRDYLVFVSDGQVIGRLDGEFDLEALPPHLRKFAADHLLNRCSSFDAPLAPAPLPPPPSSPAAPIASGVEYAGLMQKIRSLFLGR